MVNLEAAGLTDVGQVRTSNEDAFGYCVEEGVFALCDGMGGAAAGEIASRIAVDTLIERLCAADSHENRKKVLEAASPRPTNACMRALKRTPPSTAWEPRSWR